MRYYHLLLIIIITCFSCEKLIDAGVPTDSMVEGNIFNNDVTAAGVLTGMYATMSEGGFSNGNESISFFGGLSADEFSLLDKSTWYTSIWQNDILPSHVPFWTQLYALINQANVAIKNLQEINSLTPVVKQHLLGEAYFIRAFCYYYLTNFFGNVPLVLGTDYSINAKLPRAADTLVTTHILLDLSQATTLLSAQFLDADVINPSAERVRPSRWAAIALTTRVALSKQDYTTARTLADSIITHSELFDLVPLNQVFLKNSKEAIWQLQPVEVHYTQDAYLFLKTKPITLSPSLLTAFETSDQRQQQWIISVQSGSTIRYYPNKYRVWKENNTYTEYLSVFRLAEIYLMRAESRIALGDINGALADLNQIRQRAGLPQLNLSDAAAINTAILHERQVEYFSEWGHRWLDLRRTNHLNAVMDTVTTKKGGTWLSTHQWYPIPNNDIIYNASLVQNEGY